MVFRGMCPTLAVIRDAVRLCRKAPAAPRRGKLSCRYIWQNYPVSTLAGREHIPSASGDVLLATKRVVTGYQLADCGPQGPRNPGDVGLPSRAMPLHGHSDNEAPDPRCRRDRDSIRRPAFDT